MCIRDRNRYTWIKGLPDFDTLRQACIDPELRAYVGESPPIEAIPSQVISNIKVSNADWLETKDIPVNSGLVAIIGAKGSGKTALADVIAAGCDAVPVSTWNDDNMLNPSFLARARDLVGDAEVSLTWASGDTDTRLLNGSDTGGSGVYKKARYLSQQFVDCLLYTSPSPRDS